MKNRDISHTTIRALFFDFYLGDNLQQNIYEYLKDQELNICVTRFTTDNFCIIKFLNLNGEYILNPSDFVSIYDKNTLRKLPLKKVNETSFYILHIISEYIVFYNSKQIYEICPLRKFKYNLDTIKGR